MVQRDICSVDSFYQSPKVYFIHDILLYFVGKDLCKKTVSGYPRKGYITWPDTAVGRRRLVRCPYAYTEPMFVGRDCLLVDIDNSSLLTEAQWYPKFVDMDICPDPPFSRHVRQLYDRLVIITVIAVYRGSNCKQMSVCN